MLPLWEKHLSTRVSHESVQFPSLAPACSFSPAEAAGLFASSDEVRSGVVVGTGS